MYKGTCINKPPVSVAKKTGGLPHHCGRSGPGPSPYDGTVLTILDTSGVLPSKRVSPYTTRRGVPRPPPRAALYRSGPPAPSA